MKDYEVYEYEEFEEEEKEESTLSILVGWAALFGSCFLWPILISVITGIGF